MYIIDAQNFYLHIKNKEIDLDFQKLSDEQFSIIYQFCNAKKSKTVFGKMRLVKRLINHLIKLNLISPIRVKFCLDGKGLASMLDKGQIRFNWRFFMRQTFLESVVVTLHEVAHAVLWSKGDYQALKECDVVFLNKYVKDASCTVTCPIEYYANVISLGWINQVLESGKMDDFKASELKALFEREKSKLEKAKERV